MKEPRRQVYLQRVSLFLPPPSPVLANLVNTKHLYNICTVVDQRRRPTLYKGNTMLCVCWATSMQHIVSTQYRFNVGQASQPIVVLMPVNRIRRWPNFETEIRDCPLFGLTVIWVTLSLPKGHYSDNTIHWVNYEIMLGHRLRRWANIIPSKTI